MAYQVGDLVRVAAVWTNSAGAPTDPTAVFAQTKAPDGTVTELEYNADVALVKDSTGNYHVDIDANAAGIWRYRFYSTGTGQGANEGYFVVEPSAFAL
jgi:hypothetical protein